MTSLGGSTANGAAGGVSSGLAAGGVSGPQTGGGATAPETGGGLSGGGLLVRSTTQGATGGESAPQPNGAATPLGRLLAGTVAPHAHEDEATGGVVNYARLVVAATPPAAPATPSDAFWLNPAEEA